MFNKLKIELAEQKKVVFYVHIVPNAPKSKIIEIMSDESVKIAIAATAERGKANKELIKFLAKEFGVVQQNIEIITGTKQRIKLIAVKK